VKPELKLAHRTVTAYHHTSSDQLQTNAVGAIGYKAMSIVCDYAAALSFDLHGELMKSFLHAYKSYYTVVIMYMCGMWTRYRKF